MIHRLRVDTDGPGATEITATVAALIPPGDGLATLMVRHTSASLLITENADPEVLVDLRTWLARTVPPTTHPSMADLTHTYEGPDDMPAHIRAMLLPTTLSIPVTDGRMLLGRWQGVFLFEHRDRGRPREVLLHHRADP